MATETMERTQIAAAGESSLTQRVNGWLGNATPEQVANGLGWFSIGLGLAEFLAPGTMARVVGAEEGHGALMRLLGPRGVAAGCWSRVAGDLIDLALLGADLGAPETDKGKAIGSTAAVVGVTVLDTLTAWELSQTGSGAFDVRVQKSITVNKSPEECYAFWRDF